MQKFDFHAHSYYSDGTYAPYEVARRAKENGLAAFALTDHDTLSGLDEAENAAKKLNIAFVPGIEFDITSDYPLHILGLGINRKNVPLKLLVEMAEERRLARNDEMLKKLRAAGYDIDSSRENVKGVYSRLHMALALVERGFAKDKTDAFRRFVGSGGLAFVKSGGTPRHAAIAAIHSAGGVAVLAHPSKLKCDVHTLIKELKEMKLDGLEAYYPTTSDSERALFLSLAKQNELIVSAGSDFHGNNRPEVDLGCTWTNDNVLEKIYELLVEKAKEPRIPVPVYTLNI